MTSWKHEKQTEEMKRFLLVVILLACVVADAADVKWNFVDVVQHPPGGASLETTLKSGDSSWVGFSLSFTVAVSGKNATLSNFDCNLSTAITWASLALDDIVYQSAFGDEIPSLFSTEYSGATGSLSVNVNQPFYLAFQVFELIDNGLEGITRGDAYYGWTEFRIAKSSDVELISSAVDLDGYAMIVGGGTATPEPSSGVLLLLGLSLLSLRRRAT